MSTIDELNARVDPAAIAGRTANDPPTAPKTAARKRGARKPAPEFTPGETALRAAFGRTPTATIRDYRDYLERVVFDGKLSAKLTDRERVVGMAFIRLYGAYQGSPERRAARGL